MEQDVITSVEGLLPLEEQWQRLHASARGNIFQTFDWTATWCQTYGEQFPLRILVFREGGQLVAVFPFFLQRLGLFPIRICRLRLVGEYGVFGEYLPLVMPGHETEAVGRAARYLGSQLRSGACDVVDFANHPAASPLMETLASRMRGEGFVVRQNSRWMSRYLLHLPATWEQYLGSLGGKERKDLNRTLRRLRDVGASVVFLSKPEECFRAMSDLERLHAAAWQTRGNGGHFIADDGFATFWRAIIPRLIRKGMVWFTFYELGGERIAGAQGFIVGETCCGYIAGRSLGRTLQTLGIGKAATAQCIAAAIRRRCSVFDFLGGGHDYKRRLGAEQNFIARMVVYPKGVKRAAVVVLLIALRVRFFFRVIAWQSIVGEVARRGFGPKA